MYKQFLREIGAIRATHGQSYDSDVTLRLKNLFSTKTVSFREGKNNKVNSIERILDMAGD